MRQSRYTHRNTQALGPGVALSQPWEGQWLAQGGADVAAAMLADDYDVSSQTWSMPSVGSFWDAVAMARDLGLHGEDTSIAVVDEGFDMTVPPLGGHVLVWPASDATLVAHGTVVALLILAVAPLSRLRLYPTALDGEINTRLVERAINDAADRRMSVINLSFGQAVRSEKVVDFEQLFVGAPLGTMSSNELLYWIGRKLGELEGWRSLLHTVDSDVTRSTRAAAERGCTVVAAAGNYRGFVYSPGTEVHTVSVGFQGERRSLTDEMVELAQGTAPTFWQSEWADFTLRQPDDVLGSSFATPLLAGFAALMKNRADLYDYREVQRLAGIAAHLFVDAKRPHGWAESRQGVIKGLFEKAVARTPSHDHLTKFLDAPSGTTPVTQVAKVGNTGEVEPRCPECSLLTADAFINLGLFRLETGNYDGARTLLEAARSFAPENEHAAANLGVTYGALAGEFQKEQDWPTVVDLLQRARASMEKAVDLRPGCSRYQLRYEEFTAGARNPQQWVMAR